MIVLDHNITRDQAELLSRWRIRFHRIGVEIGLPSWDDEQEILRHLHRSKQITFFTRDLRLAILPSIRSGRIHLGQD